MNGKGFRRDMKPAITHLRAEGRGPYWPTVWTARAASMTTTQRMENMTTAGELASLAANPDVSILELGRMLGTLSGEWPDEEAPAILRAAATGTPLAGRLEKIAPEMLLAVLRSGAGLPASAHSTAAARWIAANSGRWSKILSPDAKAWNRITVSLAGAQAAIAMASAQQDRETAQRLYDAMMAEAGADLAIGVWMEHRTVYSTDNYRSALVPGARRDRHLGCDLFAPALTPLCMPMPGEVVQTAIIDERLDYGGLLVTRHEIEPGVPLFALWGHLSHESARRWKAGDNVPEGAEIAVMGDFEENGWWLPHLHLQLSTLEFSDFRAMPGVGEAACADLWAEIFPDPAPLVLGD